MTETSTFEHWKDEYIAIQKVEKEKGSCEEVARRLLIWTEGFFYKIRGTDFSEEDMKVILEIKKLNANKVGDIKYEMAREFATDLFKREYGNKVKGNLWVCHRASNSQSPMNRKSKKGRCAECGESLLYDPGVRKNMQKNAKKVCSVCVLKDKKYSKKLSPEQKMLLEGGLNDN